LFSFRTTRLLCRDAGFYFVNRPGAEPAVKFCATRIGKTNDLGTICLGSCQNLSRWQEKAGGRASPILLGRGSNGVAMGKCCPPPPRTPKTRYYLRVGRQGDHRKLVSGARASPDSFGVISCQRCANSLAGKIFNSGHAFSRPPGHNGGAAFRRGVQLSFAAKWRVFSRRCSGRGKTERAAMHSWGLFQAPQPWCTGFIHDCRRRALTAADPQYAPEMAADGRPSKAGDFCSRGLWGGKMNRPRSVISDS